MEIKLVIMFLNIAFTPLYFSKEADIKDKQ